MILDQVKYGVTVGEPNPSANWWNSKLHIDIDSQTTVCTHECCPQACFAGCSFKTHISFAGFTMQAMRSPIISTNAAVLAYVFKLTVLALNPDGFKKVRSCAAESYRTPRRPIGSKEDSRWEPPSPAALLSVDGESYKTPSRPKYTKNNCKQLEALTF